MNIQDTMATATTCVNEGVEFTARYLLTQVQRIEELELLVAELRKKNEQMRAMLDMRQIEIDDRLEDVLKD